MSQRIRGYETFYFVASLFLVVAGLHLAREILVPVALAVLISFVLGPIVIHIEKFGLSRIASVLFVSIFSFSVLLGIGWIVTQQVTELSSELPSYKNNLLVRIKKLNSSATTNLSAFRKAFQELNDELTGPSQGELSRRKNAPSIDQREQTLGANPHTPLWTTEVEPPRSPLAIIKETLQPVIWPFASAGIIAVLVVFMLMQREDLRDRIIRLIGEGRLTVTTEALDEAASKLSNYLSMQFLVNSIFGICIALALWLLNIPNAPLWGLLSFSLRFVPYIGAWIATSLPILFALASSSNSWDPLNILCAFVVIEIITGNIIEPLLLSRSTGISPIAVLLAAVFWTWVWGPIGLLLSTPLTVCLVVMGKYIPALQFATILLGDKPALELHLRLYQRLLAADQEEAVDIMYETLKQHPLSYFYEKVIIQALFLAEMDLHSGIIDETKLKVVRNGLRQLVEEAYEQREQLQKKQLTTDTHFQSKEGVPSQNILLLPCRDEADELCALAASNLLTEAGHHSKVISSTALTSEMAKNVQEAAPDIVIVSALPPSAISNAKYLLKKIRERHPDIPTIVGFWNIPSAVDKAKVRIGIDPHTHFVSSIEEALVHIQQLALLDTKSVL